MSEYESVDSAVCRLIGGVVPPHIAKKGVRSDMILRQELEVDSIGLLSIIFVLEEAFSVDLASSLERLVQADRVADVVDIIRVAVEQTETRVAP